MAYDDLLINGTSLKTLGYIADFAGIFSDGPLRGSSIVYPNVPGARWTPKVRDTYVFTVPMVLLADGWGSLNSKVDSLRALLDSSTGAFVMTRHRSLTGAGTSVQTADGEFLSGLQPAVTGMTVMRLALDFVNLSGEWT
jgi:hypothetical protein